MAIIKSKTHPSGVEATYWSLLMVFFDAKAGQSTWRYGGYVSKQHQLDGAQPLMEQSVTILAGANPELAAATLGYGQSVALSDPFFEGGIEDT